jgi:hypothetical protein
MAALRQQPVASAGTPVVPGVRWRAVFSLARLRIPPLASGDLFSAGVPALAATVALKKTSLPRACHIYEELVVNTSG